MAVGFSMGFIIGFNVGFCVGFAVLNGFALGIAIVVKPTVSQDFLVPSVSKLCLSHWEYRSCTTLAGIARPISLPNSPLNDETPFAVVIPMTYP